MHNNCGVAADDCNAENKRSGNEVFLANPGQHALSAVAAASAPGNIINIYTCNFIFFWHKNSLDVYHNNNTRIPASGHQQNTAALNIDQAQTFVISLFGATRTSQMDRLLNEHPGDLN